jgi:Uma2 family endonuclease
MSDPAYLETRQCSFLRKAMFTKRPRKHLYSLPLIGAYTYNDYKEWDLGPGERYELINGTPQAMSSPSAKHQIIVTELSRQFANFLLDKSCKVFSAPYDVRLFYQKDGEDNVVVQPDLTVVCDRKKRGPEGCRGAPDLVIEVLSPSNSTLEMYRKLNLYQEAGVREYWVVDLEEQAILVYTLHSGRFILNEYKTGDLVCSAVLAGLEINVTELFARLKEEEL